MLRRTGLIKPVPLVFAIEKMFSDCIYETGSGTATDFAPALLAHVQKTGRVPELRLIRRKGESKPWALDDLLSLESKTVFNVKSVLVMFQEANWDVDRITHTDIRNVHTYIGEIRLCRTKQTIDPPAEKYQFEETALVHHMKRLKGDEFVEETRTV